MQTFVVAAALVALPAVSAQLNQLAKAAGKVYFGTATDNPELVNTAYVTILNDTAEWGQITPGNAQKWEYIEPTEDVFTYTEAEQITDLAEANGQLLRCHNLVWESELPSWGTPTFSSVSPRPRLG
jgi:endo-1,4-beta-xylanase